MRIMPVQRTTITLGPNQSRKRPPMIGHIELTIASEAVMTLNWVLLMPSSLRRVFLRGPRAADVHVTPMGRETTRRRAIHL